MTILDDLLFSCTKIINNMRIATYYSVQWNPLLPPCFIIWRQLVQINERKHHLLKNGGGTRQYGNLPIHPELQKRWLLLILNPLSEALLCEFRGKFLYCSGNFYRKGLSSVNASILRIIGMAWKEETCFVHLFHRPY